MSCTVDGVTIETERLLLRRPVEADRNRFVELFTDDESMVFGARLNIDSANARFDDMLDRGLVELADEAQPDAARPPLGPVVDPPPALRPQREAVESVAARDDGEDDREPQHAPIVAVPMIPVAGAMQSTGTADLIARFMLENVAQGYAVPALALILIVTMFLSDLMNNAATAAVMCPIAIGTANALGVSADSFLMAVAIGASCAFLTPIGHQNNTLILGPGGFRFGDYWKLGLPLEIMVAMIAVPLLLVVWPL